MQGSHIPEPVLWQTSKESDG